MTTHQHKQEVTPEFLNAFVDAWNAYDVDKVLTFFHKDIVFETSSGDEVCGKRFVGLAGARQAVERVIKALPHYKFTDGRTLICGDRGVLDWTMTHTAPTGERISVRGCDLLEFKDGKISRKDSYRKNRPSAEYQVR